MEATMRFSFPIKSIYYRWLIVFAGVLFLASGYFIGAGQPSAILPEYFGTVSPEVKNAVEALIRGENLVPQIAEEELQRRQAYAIQHFGGVNTDRGRFYVYWGAPDGIETDSPRSKREWWEYRKIGFAVEFPEPEQVITVTTSRPDEIPSDRWIPLSENSGIAIQNMKSKSTLHSAPLVYGTLWAKINGTWTEVSLSPKGRFQLLQQ
jgi:hypothetical protein